MEERASIIEAVCSKGKCECFDRKQGGDSDAACVAIYCLGRYAGTLLNPGSKHRERVLDAYSRRFWRVTLCSRPLQLSIIPIIPSPSVELLHTARQYGGHLREGQKRGRHAPFAITASEIAARGGGGSIVVVAAGARVGFIRIISLAQHPGSLFIPPARAHAL